MNQEMTGSAERPHIPTLDGLRGVAILLVLVQHYYLSLLVTTDSWVDQTLIKVAGVGWTGVDLFFVLSGFLITGILLDAKEGKGSYFGSFYARRFLRIFPPVYLFFFVMFFVLPNIGPVAGHEDLERLADDQLWFWTFTQNVRGVLNFDTAYGSFNNGHLWSLAVEEQFYLVWPVIVLALGRRSLLFACGAILVGALIFRTLLVENVVPEIGGSIAAFVLMPARMDTLAIGAMIAIVAQRPEQLALARRLSAPVAAIAFIVLAAIIISQRGYFRGFEYRTTTLGLSALALLYGALIVRAITTDPGSLLYRIGTHPVLTTFGKYSYAIYIVHYQLMLLLLYRVREAGGMPLVYGMDWPSRTFMVFIGASMSLTVAWLSWHIWERQFLRLKRFFPYGRPASAPLPSPQQQAAEPVPAEAVISR